jgi:hypothetical protein
MPPLTLKQRDGLAHIAADRCHAVFLDTARQLARRGFATVNETRSVSGSTNKVVKWTAVITDAGRAELERIRNKS